MTGSVTRGFNHRRGELPRSSQAGDAGGLDTATASGKLLALLDAFSPRQPELSLAELAARTGLPKSTCHRILAVLEAWGGVTRAPSGRYRLGLKMFKLGGLVHERSRLRELALPYMEDLFIATDETVHLAKLDGREMICIDRIVGHRSVVLPTAPGERGPATCTSLGKAILAFSPRKLVDEVIGTGLPAVTPYSVATVSALEAELTEIRRTGVAYDREERRIGLNCVAAPIFGQNGAPIAAISVTGPVGRFSPESFAPAVRAGTLAISRRLGYRPSRS